MITFIIIKYNEKTHIALLLASASSKSMKLRDTQCCVKFLCQMYIIYVFIVVPCILITLKLLSPTNAPLYYTYKMLKYTVKISHDCSYMFRSTCTIIREPMLSLAKVTILCLYQHCWTFNDVCLLSINTKL
jgi:hypothetical protein